MHIHDILRLVLIDNELLAWLEYFLTPRRIQRMKNVLEHRTRYIVCVLEDLYDPRNGSAVIRHCDAMGIQEIHAIEDKNRFRSDKQVDMGSGQWVDVHIHNDTLTALKTLKTRGYRIVATCPNTDTALAPEEIDLKSGPVALVFGTEKHGISKEVHRQADAFVRIPMQGFVNSLNISASAAIIFHILRNRIRKENLAWQLDAGESEEIYYRWVRRSIPHLEQLVSRFRDTKNQEASKNPLLNQREKSFTN